MATTPAASAWTLSADLSGTTPASLDNGGSLPEGVYPVKIIGTSMNEKNNLKIDGVIATGEFQGSGLSVTIGGDQEKPGNRIALMTALVSCGHPRAEIQKKGKITVKPSSFEGKSAFMYHKPKDETKGEKYHTRKFVSPKDAEGYLSMRARVQAASDVEVDTGLDDVSPATDEAEEEVPQPKPATKPTPAPKTKKAAEPEPEPEVEAEEEEAGSLL